MISAKYHKAKTENKFQGADFARKAKNLKTHKILTACVPLKLNIFQKICTASSYSSSILNVNKPDSRPDTSRPVAVPRPTQRPSLYPDFGPKSAIFRPSTPLKGTEQNSRCHESHFQIAQSLTNNFR